MTPDYTKLEAAILNQIGTEPKQLALIFVGDIRHECVRIAAEQGTRRSPFGINAFHILNRRLQALRKRGAIHSTTKGWVRDSAA